MKRAKVTEDEREPSEVESAGGRGGTIFNFVSGIKMHECDVWIHYEKWSKKAEDRNIDKSMKHPSFWSDEKDEIMWMEHGRNYSKVE